ncbi:hypothetical protein PT2222_70106 [Paraburkholderia tropica]
MAHAIADRATLRIKQRIKPERTRRRSASPHHIEAWTPQRGESRTAHLSARTTLPSNRENGA